MSAELSRPAMSDAASSSSALAEHADPKRGGREHVAARPRALDDCLPMLGVLHERLAHYLGLGLSEYLNREVTVQAAPAVVERYAYFSRRQTVPTHIEVVAMEPLRSAALVLVQPHLISLVVDLLFGGDGRFQDRVKRSTFTPTEQRIIDGLLNVILSEYARVWAPLCELQPQRLRSVNNPWLANVVMPEEQVVTTRFALGIGQLQTELSLCLPTALLAPLRDPLLGAEKNLRQPPDPRWYERLSKHLQSVEVELSYCLGRTSLTLADIVDLRIGDVIALDDSNGPTLAEVAGVPLIACRHGIMNGRYALKIDALVPPDDDPRLKQPGNTHD